MLTGFLKFPNKGFMFSIYSLTGFFFLPRRLRSSLFLQNVLNFKQTTENFKSIFLNQHENLFISYC